MVICQIIALAGSWSDFDPWVTIAISMVVTARPEAYSDSHIGRASWVVVSAGTAGSTLPDEPSTVWGAIYQKHSWKFGPNVYFDQSSSCFQVYEFVAGFV